MTKYNYIPARQCIYNVTPAKNLKKMELDNLIERITEKINECDAFEKQSHERGNINMALMYLNQKTGLYTALNIALEEQGKEISGE